ncbi:MAG: hypothetical protein K2Q18_05835 [Bdellovibrionales bacterium]|nr:hypothetical protein [Bdellovibrionales bacterium]
MNMKRSKYLSDIFSLTVIGLCLASAYLIAKQTEKPAIVILKQQSSLNINNDFLKYFNLGQKRLYSSLFWVATILESDHDHYKGKDLNSWMFIRFLTVSNLEPKFLPTYTFGGPYLSIIKDDLEGASVIYDRGLNIYPNEYDLLSNAAFHYQFEKIDHKKSYEIYKKLNKNTGKKITQITQLARLESEQGNSKEAFKLLYNLYSKQLDKKSLCSSDNEKTISHKDL